MDAQVLEKLLEISRQLAQTRSLEPLLEYSMDMVLEIVMGEHGMLILKDGDQLDYRIHRTQHGQNLLQPEKEISHSILNKVFTDAQPLKLVDAIADPEFALSSSVGMLQLRSVMCVPLITREEVIGAIYVENRSSNGVFRQQELDILTYFAGQAAVAIENAMLNDQLESKVQQRTAVLRYALSQLQAEIEERESLRRVLEDNQHRLDAILNNAADAVIIFDADLRIERFNLAAEYIFGYSLDEIRGQSLNVLLPEVYRPNHQQHVDNFVWDKRHTQLMYSREGIFGRRKNGEVFPAEVSVTKLDTYTGRIYTTILRDITERKEAEEEIQNQNRELNAFAHTVAHDLKNPLSSIVGYASMLFEMRQENEEIELYVQRLLFTSMNMANIVDNLLLLATVRQADVTLYPLDMGEIMRGIHFRMQHLLDEHDAQLTLPEDWHAAQGYAGWIEEVWANYLSNALKYGGTPPQITLGSEVLPDGRVRFWVQDNGPGISPERQVGLFTEFNRLGEKRGRGHGLGLSIVKRIVDKLGGEVGVESTPGQGSRFSFILPGVQQEI